MGHSVVGPRLWEVAGPWGGTNPPGVAYVYAPDRTASQPIAHLAGFNGVLQVDGYAGYRALAGKGDVTLAFCWAHLRRRFYERAVAEASPIANEALERRPPGPIASDCRRVPTWLREKLALLSRKSKLAQANPLRALPPGRSLTLPRRRADRDRLQHRRAVDQASRSRVERFGWTFAPGDKVMQIENDYDEEVYNGDIGYIDDVDSGSRRTQS